MNMKYFEYDHLPEKLQEVSRPISELANLMNSVLMNSEEKETGLRKLLEAKDCFVRAALDTPTAFPKPNKAPTVTESVVNLPRNQFVIDYHKFETLKKVDEMGTFVRGIVRLKDNPSIYIMRELKLKNELEFAQAHSLLRYDIIGNEAAILAELLKVGDSL